MEVGVFSQCKLLPLVSFGESVIASENREYEQMFELRELHVEFLEQILNRDKHWCLDRMEIFSEEDEKEYLTFCKIITPEEIIIDTKNTNNHTNNNDNQQTILLIGEAGVGKTCLLYHLWKLAIDRLINKKQQQQQTNEISSKENKEEEIEQQDDYLPIYVSAKQIFIEHKKQQKQGEGEVEVQFDSMMKAIASASINELDPSSFILPTDELKELILNIIQTQKIILLIDELDLIPLDQLQAFIQFFKSSASSESFENRPVDTFTGKALLSVRNTSFQGLTPFSQIELLLSENIRCLELFPGFTFNILTTSQIRSLLKRWPMIENAGSVQESVGHWVAFEYGLRAHRTKLFPNSTHSPLLLFLLARRLAKGTLSDVDQGTDREFNIYELLDDLYNDCLREQYIGFVPQTSFLSPNELPPENNNNNMDLDISSHQQSNMNSDDISMDESSDPMNICNNNNNPNNNPNNNDNLANSSSSFNESENLRISIELRNSQQAEIAMQKAKEKFPVLHGYDIDIAQLKRLCSLIGFLCHWANPRCLLNESRITRQNLVNRLPQLPFVQKQLKHLLAKPGIANLLGFNAMMDDSDLNSSKLELSDLEIEKITNEIFSLLSYFYDITVDGRILVKHPILEEFIAAKFLTEPSYFYNMITEALTNQIPYDNDKENNKEFHLRIFQWNDSFFQTDWWWDGVFQFAGIRRSVIWLAGKILRGSVYDTKHNSNNAAKNSSNNSLRISNNNMNSEGSNNNSSSTIVRDPNRDQNIFEYYLRNLQSIGVDVEDLGQIRFQILLRVYSSICNHRSPIENSNDPITEWMGKAFSGLVERSLTVFVHLEVFPNYFLSAFNANICNSIIKRCISIFVKRSTHHAIHLISKFHFSPYLKRHLPSLLDIYTRREPKSRLAIFEILKNIDQGNLEKTNVADMVQMLGDFDGNVRREVVSELVSLGIQSSQQIEKSLLSRVFEFGDPLPVISTAVTALTNLVEYSDDLDTSPQQMLHSKHTSTITALLEQSDPGTRLLAYICFGSPNFQHNANEDNGIPARKAALHVCARLRSSCEKDPIFASSSIENLGTSQQKIRGDYCYTVALNSLITESLGETAVCWVSSVMDLLKFKSFLIHKVSALSFSSLHSEESRKSIFQEFLSDNNYVIHAQIFEVLLLVHGNELLSCIDILHEYIRKNIISPQQPQTTTGLRNSGSGNSGNNDKIIPPFVKVLALKVYNHICKIFPSDVSLNVICDTILSFPPPSVIDQAVLALQTITTNGIKRSSQEEFLSIVKIITNFLYIDMHFIASEALKAIGNLSPDCIDPSKIPIIDILIKSFGSVRQSCIYMIDKHPLLFKSKISNICELFKHQDQNSLNSCYIRSSAVSTLACMSRRGLSEEIISEIITNNYLNSSKYPYYVIESAARTISLIPFENVSLTAKEKIFENLNHKSHRVIISIIDALGYFGEDLILTNTKKLCKFAQFLSHEDSEIRSATQNAFERMKIRILNNNNNNNNNINNNSTSVCISNNNNNNSSNSSVSDENKFLFDDFIQLNQDIEDLFVTFVSSESYYQRMAAVHLFKFFGTNVMIKLHEIISVLLVDPTPCIRIEILQCLREFIGNSELYSRISQTFIELIEQKGSRTPADSQVLRETYRTLRCDKMVANDVSKYAQASLNLYFEDIQVKKQAVLLLSSIDKLDSENVQSLVDMLKTNDAKILTEVANIFARSGISIVRLIPKMFGYMKGEHPTIKRKLLRFISPFKDQVKDEYVQLYHHIITMTTDTDSIVRKKAAELLTMVACSLPVDLPDGLTNTVTNAIIEALVEINLDRNSFVRREAAVSLSEIGTFQPQFIPLIHRKLLKIDDDPFSNILIWRLFSFRWGSLIEKQVKSSK